MRFSQKPLRQRHRIILPEPPRFLARVFLKCLLDVRVTSRRPAGEFFKRLEHHPGVPRGRQAIPRGPQRLHSLAVSAHADLAAHQPEERAELFDFLSRPVHRRRMFRLAKTIQRRPHAFPAHAPHSLGGRF